MQNTKRRLATVAKDLENLKWENEVLELRFEKVRENHFKGRYIQTISSIQQKRTRTNNVRKHHPFVSHSVNLRGTSYTLGSYRLYWNCNKKLA